MPRKNSKVKDNQLDSITDLKPSNVWSASAQMVARLWEEERINDNFKPREEKILNIIRTAFEVVQYDADDDTGRDLCAEGEWAVLNRHHSARGYVTIRRRQIKQLKDLTADNISYVSAATLLDLIDRNFGGGWAAVPLGIRSIIEAAFDIADTKLPTTRMHAPGGAIERKTAAGYEVLELPCGNWTEAIFAKKKEDLPMVVETPDQEPEVVTDEDFVLEEAETTEGEQSGDEDTFYSNYIDEGEMESEDGEADETGYMMDEE